MPPQPVVNGAATPAIVAPPNDSRNRVFIELRTDAASRLVAGRASGAGKAAIIGLFGFADRLRVVWDAAKAGDPYARWWLLKVESTIATARTLVREERNSVQETLSAANALGIDLAGLDGLRRVDLLFACPYAYHGAQLVKQVDLLITELDTAVQIGALSRTSATAARRRGERALRHLFATAQGFHDFELTESLIARRSAIAVEAESKMGLIPENVLAGARWPTLLARSTPTGNRGDA